MTDDEKALDKASKRSALAVLGMALVSSIALFPSPFIIPLVSLPLWGVGLAVTWQSPVIGVATAAGGYFFFRHWQLHRRLRKD